MVNTKVCTASCKFCSFELIPIICEDPSRYVKPVYDTLQELDCYILRDVYYWHDLHPLGKSVDSDE
jgi:2-iminoacetate synthase ThiH